MKDSRFRKALSEYCEDKGLEKVIILDHAAYDRSVVGITEDGRLVYDYQKMVDEFAEDENCKILEAMEWVDYNTLRAIPYMGENAPIVVLDSRDAIINIYGPMGDPDGDGDYDGDCDDEGDLDGDFI